MNNMKTAGLLGLLGAIFVFVGFLLGGTGGATTALVFAALINLGVYFFSDKLALRSTRAIPVTEEQLPEVYRIVRTLAQQQNMPMPRIYFIESPQPNAFATGRNPQNAAVAVTRGILDLMNYQELEGVLAHELSHVRNRDILISTIAATIGAALSFLTRIAFWTGLGGRDRNSGPIGAIGAILALIIGPVVAMLMQFAISRTREYQADRSGAEMTGSPLALASALRKLEMGTSRIPMQTNDAVAQLFIADPMKAFGRSRRSSGMHLFSTHPPIEERVKRLEAMASGIR